MSERTCLGPFRGWTWGAIVALALLTTPAAWGFGVGDRVEVKRGLEWARGTVTAFDQSRNRYTVRLDDDGSLENLTPEQREKRLTRNYFPSDMREVRGADTPPPVTPPSTTPSPAPAMQGSTVTVPPDSVVPRTWSDKSGRFKIEATYRGMNGAKVVLEKTDGTKIEVELAKLSEADNEYVDAQGAAAENPFDVPAMSSAGGGQRPASGTPDLSRMKIIEPQRFANWTFKPSGRAAPSGARKGHRIRLSDLPNSQRFFEEYGPISLAADGQRALLVRKEGKVGGDDQYYVDDLDLASGKSLGTVALPRGKKLLAASGQFGLVVWKEGELGSDNNEIGVARVRDGRLEVLAEFVPPFPGRDLPEAFNDVDNAWIVGPTHVMVAGFHQSSPVIWDVSSLSAVCQIPRERAGRSDSLALSPNHQLAAIPADQSIAIIDLHAAAHVATLPFDSFSPDGLAFNDDNTRLAVHDGGKVHVFDLTTGKPLSSFQHKTMFGSDSYSWAGDFLLHRNKYLYDHYHRVLLWELEGLEWHEGTSVAGAGLIATVQHSRHEEGPVYFETAPMPTQEMIDLAKSLGDPDSLVIARPGDKIAIDLDIDPNVANEDEVYRGMVINLEKIGLEVVVDDVPLVIKGFCRQRPTETIRISMRDRFGRPEEVIERTITPHPTYVSITYQGIEVWRSGTSGQPGGVIWTEQGESIDQALVRLTTPKIELITNAHIELPLIRPGKATPNGAYGTSNLSGGKGAPKNRF